MGDDRRDDAELIADTQAGDADAFGVLFMRHHALVLAYLMRHTRDTAAADDLLAGPSPRRC